MRIIAGEYKGRRLKTTSGPGYRPATGRVREALFAMLESLGIDWTQVRVLDVFAGSGSLGLEALSRGAEAAWFVEKNKPACSLIGQNAADLGIQPARVRLIRQNALTWLRKENEKAFDLVFVDPPYGQKMLVPALKALCGTSILSSSGLVCAEAEGDLDFDPDRQEGLQLMKDRKYGQTRIIIWKRR